MFRAGVYSLFGSKEKEENFFSLKGKLTCPLEKAIAESFVECIGSWSIIPEYLSLGDIRIKVVKDRKGKVSHYLMEHPKSIKYSKKDIFFKILSDIQNMYVNNVARQTIKFLEDKIEYDKLDDYNYTGDGQHVRKIAPRYKVHSILAKLITKHPEEAPMLMGHSDPEIAMIAKEILETGMCERYEV